MGPDRVLMGWDKVLPLAVLPCAEDRREGSPSEQPGGWVRRALSSGGVARPYGRYAPFPVKVAKETL